MYDLKSSTARRCWRSAWRSSSGFVFFSWSCNISSGGLIKFRRPVSTYLFEDELQSIRINVSSTPILLRHYKEILEVGLGSDLEPLVLYAGQHLKSLQISLEGSHESRP